MGLSAAGKAEDYSCKEQPCWSPMTLGKLIGLSEPQYSHLQNGTYRVVVKIKQGNDVK